MSDADQLFKTAKSLSLFNFKFFRWHFYRHNDLPYLIREVVQNQLDAVNLTDLTGSELWTNRSDSHTDMVRMREGGVGAQFWVAYSKCDSQYKDSTQVILEQIDLIHRIVDAYPEHLEMATSAAGTWLQNSSSTTSFLKLAVDGFNPFHSKFDSLFQVDSLNWNWVSCSLSDALVKLINWPSGVSLECIDWLSIDDVCRSGGGVLAWQDSQSDRSGRRPWHRQFFGHSQNVLLTRRSLHDADARLPHPLVINWPSIGHFFLVCFGFHFT